MSLASPEPLVKEINRPSAWTVKDLESRSWLVSLPPACWQELEHAIGQLREHDGPVHEIDSSAFELSATHEFAQSLRKTQLDRGPGFAVVDRFPVQDYSKGDLTKAYWLLASQVSRPVAQTYPGRVLFDVHDIGVGDKMVPGSGIRATVTNLDLNFHNDNCFNTVMPDYVGLLCLRSARSGGVSKTISFHSVHNILAQENTGLLERLYQPIWWDRHREHGPEELPYVANPVFEVSGDVALARFSNYNIRGGYRLRGEEPDPLLRDALDRLIELFESPELQHRFTMEPGQIQFVNNRFVGHARSNFEDHDDPDRKRHLVRLWLRDWGSKEYGG